MLGGYGALLRCSIGRGGSAQATALYGRTTSICQGVLLDGVQRSFGENRRAHV